MKRTKYIALILCIAMVLSLLAGCGNTEVSDTTVASNNFS